MGSQHWFLCVINQMYEYRQENQADKVVHVFPAKDKKWQYILQMHVEWSSTFQTTSKMTVLTGNTCSAEKQNFQDSSVLKI